ncbi:MAG: electron transport complex protein RnfE [Fusobacteria bacterium]|nr:MAG: electron transport complex protein RnfE [Fusobacteriota bacterium]KAF0229661.1 MAG: electron transport complex protein [Fusobacteriota bacterium]
MKISDIFKDGIYRKNAILIMLLGMCPTLAVTTTLSNAIGMGISVIVILTLSNISISIMRKVIPAAVRIPAYIGIIAALVTIIEMLIHAYVPTLYVSLGIYLPLIVVNCIILERAESFASKNNILHSTIDGIAVGIGFTLAMLLIAFFRELLGTGAILGFTILPASTNMLIMILPPGAFLTLGIILGVMGHYSNKKKEELENE